MTPEETLGLLEDLLLAGPPRLGGTRLACVDGPAGSGKSTLARDLAARLRAHGSEVVLLALDDALEGWTGLETGVRQLLDGVLAPVREGRPGRYRRWDWLADGWAEEVEVLVPEVLLVEGCGSAPRAAAEWTNLLVVVETDAETRLARGLARDGAALRPQWLAWMEAEARVLAREGVRERADVLLDGTGRVVGRRR